MTVTVDSCLIGADGDDKVWPPGFRFHPTDEELMLYYLKRKICKRKLKLNIIGELDVYKWDPEELPGLSMLKTGDRQWFFFSPRDRKYPKGARSNRATKQGYWKATGKDRNIMYNSRPVGLKKTLVFYRGRAPNGERTNWVMHEYTLNEKELQRCPNVQDHYALYKVFKKSGPGPKNGEQYGAPFKEDDWVDSEYADVNSLVTPDIPVSRHNEDTAVDGVWVVDQGVLPSNDFEGSMKQIADGPALVQPQISNHPCVPPQVTSKEEAQSTLVDPFSGEFVFPEQITGVPAGDQQHDRHASFEFNQSAATKLQNHEALEVTSAHNSSGQAPELPEEDFLEIDDLFGPLSTLSNNNKHVDNLQFGDFDGLSELDLYHDAAMFLRDIGPVDQATVSHPYMSSLGSALVSDQLISDQLQTNPAGNQVHYHLQPQDIGTGHMGDQLWVHDQRRNLISPSGSSHETLSESLPGVSYESTTNPAEPNGINQSGIEGGDASNWLSSALWSFVDSIPTNPAAASETPLVHKAFERMSSFRARLTAKNTNMETGSNGAANVRKGGAGKRGFIFLSIFGALCAILWVLIGTVRVFGRSTSST